LKWVKNDEKEENVTLKISLEKIVAIAKTKL